MSLTLFTEMEDERQRSVAPLAVRMRPETLDEFIGQEQAIGPDSWLRRVLKRDALSSILLFGPAGTGKTTLARLISTKSKAHFVELSAVTGGVADVRKVINEATARLRQEGLRTLLFIDEIHRFSKSQQDALLHAVEDRIVTLIGATTENPFFEVNPPLVSRSRVIELKHLTDEDIEAIIERALTDERGLKGNFDLEDEAKKAIVMMSGGDARVALSTLELASQMVEEGERLIVSSMVADVLPSRQVPYDKQGDNHYDVISAFIKSMRGSDPQAAVYWLAHMLVGGEDPKFIARRMMILASEDIGNADPQALLIAEAAFKAAEVIGMPECRINLSQAAIYLALAPKSNASYLAIDEAMQEVRQGSLHLVPNHLRDRHRPGAEEYGPHLYPHSYPEAWVAQSYLPDTLQGRHFFRSTERGWEMEATKRLNHIRKQERPSEEEQ